jgi:hypothetical protein
MGEAKRKRDARERQGIATPPAIGDERQAGSPSRFIQEYVAMTMRATNGEPAVANVPCNGCTACCHYGIVKVDRSKERPEDLQHLDLVPDPDGGDMMLRALDDGTCVHLGPEGCTVHRHRPQTCRTYDCRPYGLVSLAAKYHADQRSPVWQFDTSSREDRLAMEASLPHGSLTGH